MNNQGKWFAVAAVVLVAFFILLFKVMGNYMPGSSARGGAAQGAFDTTLTAYCNQLAAANESGVLAFYDPLALDYLNSRDADAYAQWYDSVFEQVRLTQGCTRVKSHEKRCDLKALNQQYHEKDQLPLSATNMCGWAKFELQQAVTSDSSDRGAITVHFVERGGQWRALPFAVQRQ